MSALPTPKLADLDDPLSPRPAATPPPAASTTAAPARAPRRPRSKPAAATAPPATRREASLAEEPLAAIFARVPESLTNRLAKTVQAINADRSRRARVSQQDVLGALLHKHLTPDDVTELGELADAYRRLVRP